MERGQESNYPLRVYSAFQWKYDVDDGSPWWRKLYFRYVWLPIARFSYFKMKIIPFERLEPDGSLSWKERQGTFADETRAAFEAAKYRYGGWSEERFNAPEPAQTIIGRTYFDDPDAYIKYKRMATREEKVEADKFKQILAESQVAVDQFRSRTTHA